MLIYDPIMTTHSTAPPTSSHQTTVTTSVGPVEVTWTERGQGRPFLILHGGAGPVSVTGFADLLAASRPVRVLTPTHPGFGGTSRPEGLDSMAGLAATYAALIDELDLVDVVVVGSSIGGWLTAELALLANPRVGGIVLVDAVGLQLDDHPVADFFSLTMDEVVDLSYAEPDRFRLDLDTLPAPARAAMAGNRAALQVYGGTAMGDVTLHGRIPAIGCPTLVVWGAADRIATPEHGRAYADAIPGARFDLIENAGHLPQLETPERLLEDVWAFVEADTVRTTTADRATTA